MGTQSNVNDLYPKTSEEEENKNLGMNISTTCDIVPVITGGMCKAAKRHLVYIDNTREIIIII